MDRSVIAIIIQEGTKVISEILRSRPLRRRESEYSSVQVIRETSGIQNTESENVEGTACIPCVNGHFSTCSGLISDEALRMARRHGVGDEEISRINKCLDQLNAMEREDLAADKIKELPQWERDLAIYAQNEGADIRHKLENIKSVDDLEVAALQIKSARMKIGQDFFRGKLAHMSKSEKTELAERAMKKLEEEE